MSILTGVSNCILVCLLFQANLTDWSRVFKQVADTSKFGIPPTLPQTIEKTNFLSLFYFTFCFVGVQLYAVVNVLSTSKYSTHLYYTDSTVKLKQQIATQLKMCAVLLAISGGQGLHRQSVLQSKLSLLLLKYYQ